jgi:hypothetical protein
MRRLVLSLAAATALAVAAPAGAKELVKAELCGPVGCATVTDRDDLRLVPTGGETTAGPPPMSAYQRLEITVQDGPDRGDTNSWTVWYVPSAGMLAGPGVTGDTTFWPVDGEAATFMKRLAKTVEPFPAPRITEALVDGRPVSGDPSTYARLFSQRSTGSTRDGGVDWIAVQLDSPASSPWTEGMTLLYSPRTDVLLRGSEAINLPASLGDDVEHARALGSGGGRTLLPWLVASALVVALLLLAAVGAILRRRPAPEGTPEPATA